MTKLRTRIVAGLGATVMLFNSTMAFLGKQPNKSIPRGSKDIIEIKNPKEPLNYEPGDYFEFSNLETLACEMIVTGIQDDTNKIWVQMLQDDVYGIPTESCIRIDNTSLKIKYQYVDNLDGSLTIVPRAYQFGNDDKPLFKDPYEEIEAYIREFMGIMGEEYYKIELYISPISNTVYTSVNEYGIANTNFKAKLPNGDLLQYFLIEEPDGQFISEWYSNDGEGAWHWAIADTTSDRRGIYQTQEPVFNDNGEFIYWTTKTYLGDRLYTTTSMSDDGFILSEKKEEASNTDMMGEHGASIMVSYEKCYVERQLWFPNHKNIRFDFPTLGFSVYAWYFKGKLDRLSVGTSWPIKRTISEQIFNPAIPETVKLCGPYFNNNDIILIFQGEDQQTTICIDKKGNITSCITEEISVTNDDGSKAFVYTPISG